MGRDERVYSEGEVAEIVKVSYNIGGLLTTLQVSSSLRNSHVLRFQKQRETWRECDIEQYRRELDYFDGEGNKIREALQAQITRYQAIFENRGAEMKEQTGIDLEKLSFELL